MTLVSIKEFSLFVISLHLLTVPSSTSPMQISGQGRSGRSLDEFAVMLQKVTGQCWSRYMGYGNYCGPGGSGDAVDETDTCCQTHDGCYNSAQCKGWFGLQQYTERYSWSMNSSSPVCVASGSACGNGLCECDRAMVECLRTAKFEPSHAAGILRAKIITLGISPNGVFCFV